MKRILPVLVFLGLILSEAGAQERCKLNFNADWLLAIGDVAGAGNADFDDSRWLPVTLPYAFNGSEAFSKDIADLTDTISWYRKHFRLSLEEMQGKVFVEFEGVRQGADFYLNGQHLGFSENGVMACGFDLSPYVKTGDNVLAVRCDNSWQYRDRTLDSRFQWNDRNFNANYGGIPKNVFLHITGNLYQTLPLYSDLGTTGTYVYATDFDIAGRKATVNVESQVKNDDARTRRVQLVAYIHDADGKEVAYAESDGFQTIAPGETKVLTLKQRLSDMHFWSWGYGYLYTVTTYIKEISPDGSRQLYNDRVVTRTGFRKTRFAEGKVWLNDRVIMMHGYAQRTSNEWPGVGISVPAWLSDYSNALMVESGANLVRWMHVTPWKQDVESCDRVGLIQAMPAGDAEKDVEGPRWKQRTRVMRDAIIYNRNNPSILFYEGGNESISREHMLELKQIRDQYDPYGGRAIGSREMLDIDEAEYGGEMLYINKSGKHPMWAMEYCRDEGLRKYWDDKSYPYHKEGDGPLYRGQPAYDYNHNMDLFACQMVERWYDYWMVRPGTGRRVSSGGVKIVFSDTNTHHRGEANYRTSGVVDAMRLPKDAFYAHQVMWDGWVEPENDRTHIIGHWNYEPGTVKDVYVVSTGDRVELRLNGSPLAVEGERSNHYLFTFHDVPFAPGTLEAVAYSTQRSRPEADLVVTSRDTVITAGEPFALKLVALQAPDCMKADGADMALIEVEVVDKQGRRCPLANHMVHFQLWGEAKWIGGIATGSADNYVRHQSLPVECGVNRVLVRSTVNAGEIGISVSGEGLRPAYLSLKSHEVDASHYLPQQQLPCRLTRGETPDGPSYEDVFESIGIVGAQAGSNMADIGKSYDDNELSEWRSDGERRNAWVTYRLERSAAIDHITLKLSGWRQKCYPLEVYAGNRKVWEGLTDATLGYAHIDIQRPVKADRLTIRMVGPVQDSRKFGLVKELAGGAAAELDRVRTAEGKTELRIVEVDLLQRLSSKDKY